MQAVAGVSLAVRRGTLTGLIGPTARASPRCWRCWPVPPAIVGDVLYKGQDITALPAFRRARMGLVRTFQLASEFKRLTVMENLLVRGAG